MTSAADNEELDALDAAFEQWWDSSNRELCFPECKGVARATAHAMTAFLRARVAELERSKNAAYLERNQVVAALAKCFPSGTARTAIEGWSEDWHGCVYIDLPTGQVSWHYHDSHAHLFAGLPAHKSKWDGHATPEKYQRLAALPNVESQLQQVKADAERERDFIRALFDENDWPGGGDLDQFAFQDLAVKHGILREETRTEPCGEACHCAEYHGSDEMKDGVTCYRKVEWLLDRSNDGTA